MPKVSNGQIRESNDFSLRQLHLQLINTIMSRLKQKLPKQISPEKEALNYLSLISQKETGYLQDWAKINEIIEQDIESSRELVQQAEKSTVEKRQAASSKHRKQESVGKEAKGAVEDDKRIIDVRVENFVTIPQRRAVVRMRRSELDPCKHYESNCELLTLIQSEEDGSLIEESPLKNNRYRIQNKLRQSESMNYVDKIRRLSLPWVKNLPKTEKNEVLPSTQEVKTKQELRRVTEIIRNKIRRKHSNKFILPREKMGENRTEEKWNPDIIVKLKPNLNEGIEEGIDNSEMKILRSWLDNNRSKRKKTITSLLNEHFEMKYLEKKKQREKAMALKSLKAISGESHFNHL